MDLRGSRSGRVLTVVILTAAAVALAGCVSGGSEHPRVATAGTQPSVAASQPSTPASPEESDYDKALRYTRCMTEHGANMPDPVEGRPLLTDNMSIRGDSIDTITARNQAFPHCKHLLPATWPVKVDPEYARSHAFFDCMRNHGVDVPEPDANGVVREPTDPSYLLSPEYEAARRACRHLVNDPANKLPENQ